MPAAPTDPVPLVHLTALERHPGGPHLRLRTAVYRGSTLFGPALAEAAPGATPIRRLDAEVLPDHDGQPQRRVVWLLESDGGGDGWRTVDRLPVEAQGWAQAALAPDPPRRPPWQRRGGWAALMTWLDTALTTHDLERRGVPQVMKDWGISFLARVDTPRGAVYLKAVPAFFHAEVTVTSALQHQPTGAAAPLLAADPARCLMLMRDAGDPLENGASGRAATLPQDTGWTMDDSRALLRHLAHVQRAAEHTPLLQTLPDHGPEWVLGHLPRLLDGTHFLTGRPDGLTATEGRHLQALAPRLEAALRRLAASPLPRTLVHGDLHGGNVVRAGPHFTLLDWSDASLSHPFLDGGPQYLVPHHQRAEAADAYLEAWADLLPQADLRALLYDGVLAGELARVLGYTEHIQPNVAADDHDWDTSHLFHFRALLQLGEEDLQPKHHP
ncbi:phosphotransferase family protein [Deinococcus sonorensis]|uniref:Phosphotransferase family protein n=1 Tax=Deinococcus sonorensis TaxID=309891 RepID=A0ABV8YAX9_9DEIO